MVEMLISLVVLLILDFVAVRWGADSRFSTTRDGREGIR
jgi:hypothetical protein